MDYHIKHLFKVGLIDKTLHVKEDKVSKYVHEEEKSLMQALPYGKSLWQPAGL